MGAAIITLNPYLWRSSIELYSGSISKLKDMKRVSVSKIMFHCCSPTFYKKFHSTVYFSLLTVCQSADLPHRIMWSRALRNKNRSRYFPQFALIHQILWVTDLGIRPQGILSQRALVWLTLAGFPPWSTEHYDCGLFPAAGLTAYCNVRPTISQCRAVISL